MASNLRDANIFQDFTVWIGDIGKIGEAPSFQPPEINIQTEEFRGGGMDGAVEIPMGVEKIEFDFDLHTWDTDALENIGYGPGSMDVPITFRGYILSPQGKEGSVVITTRALIKSVKPSKIEAGKKADIAISCNANYYQHTVNNRVITEIDFFMKKFIINGTDRNTVARQMALGFSY